MADAKKPKISELFNRFGIDVPTELVKETEWTRVFAAGPRSSYYESKFLIDGLQLSFTTFQARWNTMSSEKRLDFASAYGAKPDFTAEDEEILDLIMRDGDDSVWSALAQFMLKHSQRDRVVNLMIERLNSGLDSPDNYIQALGLAAAPSAVSALLPYYERYRQAAETERRDGIPEDVIFGPIPYVSYILCCQSLWKITGSRRYEDEMRQYLEHPHSQVRLWAEHALRIERP